MLLRTHHEEAPWIVVRADDKPQVRLNLIRDLLTRIPTGKHKQRAPRPDSRIVREFRENLIGSGWLAP
jgi:polyphosphate kinase